MTLTDPDAALLVVDVQQGAFDDGQPALHDSENVLVRISRLAARARALAIPVVYTQFGGPPGTPLATGSDAAKIHQSVAPHAGDLVIPKADSDAFLRTALHEALSSHGVTTLVVCGLQTEFCVDATCRSAYGLGYRVVLAQDAHTTADSPALTAAQIIEHHNRTLSTPYVTLTSTDELFLGLDCLSI